jgi:hypothetical protein
MNPQFFQDVINVGAILAGFCGTFLVFRIQREADYFRNPSEDNIGDQHFTSSFLLLILASLLILVIGVLFPLFFISGVRWSFLTAEIVVAGLLSALVLLVGYFVDELVHYEIILRKWRTEFEDWNREWPIIAFFGIASISVFIVWLSLF